MQNATFFAGHKKSAHAFVRERLDFVILFSSFFSLSFACIGRGDFRLSRLFCGVGGLLRQVYVYLIFAEINLGFTI